MSDSGVKEWYEAHGMEYLPGDWDERLDNGESATPTPDRGTTRMSRAELRNDFEQLEEMGELTLLWSQREDHVVLAAIEEFFAPYISSMPEAKRNVIDAFLIEGRSQRDIARTTGVTQQAVSKQLRQAFRWLVTAVAADWADEWDYLDDNERAWQAFNNFWLRRFGTKWPLRG